MGSLLVIAIAGVAICGIGGIISILALLITALSWALIPKWRTFKNYVFLNIILAFNGIYCLPITLLISDVFLNYRFVFLSLDIFMNFFMFASCCWLMVMAMLFYTDLVKVFGSTMTRKILKCNIFGWGLPSVISIGKTINKTIIFTYNKNLLNEDIVVDYHDYFYYEEIVQNVVLIVLLGVNFFVYIKVVYSLMSSPAVKSTGNRAKRIQVATFAFIMSGVLLMVSILMTIIMLVGKKDKYYLYPFGLAVFGVQTTVINVSFLISKANRKIWKQHLESIRRSRQGVEVDSEHEMTIVIS